MKNKIFAYKGYIGIESTEAFEGCIQTFSASPSNLHSVVNATDVEISTEAFKLLEQCLSSKDIHPSKEFIDFIDELKEEGERDS